MLRLVCFSSEDNISCLWGLGLNGWLGGWEGKGGTKPDSTGNGALSERVFALKVTHVLVLGGGGLGNRQKAWPLSFCEHRVCLISTSLCLHLKLTL